MLLRIEGLTAAVAGRNDPILSDVSFTVGAGERVALVGPSGAGKTTLARLLLGLDRPVARRSGQVILGRDDLCRLTAARLRDVRRRHLAFVAQNPASALDPLRTLQWQWDQNLSTIEDLDARRDAPGFLAAFDITDRLSAFPGEWSRGMLQRLVIAMALARRPKLLVMDEPTSALDPILGAEVMRHVLRHTRDLGTSLILVTHHLGLAAALTQRHIHLRAGRIVPDVLPLSARFEVTGHGNTASRQAHDPLVPIIDARNVTVALGGREIVSDVSLQLNAGASIAIVGESGAGKSTLVRALLGLIPVSKGRIERRGQAPGLVSQDPLSALHPAMRCIDAIAEPLMVRGVAEPSRRARVREIASLLRLEPRHLDQLTQQLSVGQAQRACLARALIANPSLIVFDEPLSALDESTANEVVGAIQQARSSFGTAMVFVTHDLGFAQQVADEVHVLRHGRVVETASTRAFFTQPQSAYGRALLEAARSLGDVTAAARRPENI
jgi:peptide/nickel transport system ATP-binding protein